MPILFAPGLVYVKYIVLAALDVYEMDDRRYPRKALLLHFQRQKTKQHGLAKIRCLCTFGFGVAWEMQGNINVSIREFKIDALKFHFMTGI